MSSLTGYENKIRSWTFDHGVECSKRKSKTLARMLFERQARMSDETLERLFMHSDPTPRDAIRNVERAA